MLIIAIYEWWMIFRLCGSRPQSARAAFRRVRGSFLQAVSLPCGSIRAPVSGGKICTPVSAVTIPRFRRRRERNGLPFLLPLFRSAVSEVAAELYNCKFCRERASRSWQGALRFWLLLSHYKSSPLRGAELNHFFSVFCENGSISQLPRTKYKLISSSRKLINFFLKDSGSFEYTSRRFFNSSSGIL